jgi:hypothetical protein
MLKSRRRTESLTEKLVAVGLVSAALSSLLTAWIVLKFTSPATSSVASKTAVNPIPNVYLYVAGELFPLGIFSRNFTDSGVDFELLPDQSFVFTRTGMDSQTPPIRGQWSFGGNRIVLSPPCGEDGWLELTRENGIPMLVGQHMKLLFWMTSQEFAAVRASENTLRQRFKNKDISEEELGKALGALWKKYPPYPGLQRN